MRKLDVFLRNANYLHGSTKNCSVPLNSALCVFEKDKVFLLPFIPLTSPERERTLLTSWPEVVNVQNEG